MISVLVVAALASLALAYVLVPLWRGASAGAAEPSARVGEIDSRKRSALTAIVDLEEERALGKLTEADFDALVSGYEQDALSALEDLDLARVSVEDELEGEIAALRSRLECPVCGAARPSGTACPRCGR